MIRHLEVQELLRDYPEAFELLGGRDDLGDLACQRVDSVLGPDDLEALERLVAWRFRGDEPAP